MFAVLQTGGKQYRVARNDRITVEKLDAEPGSTIELDQVLMVGKDGEKPRVGTPYVSNARVTAEVLDQARGRKIVVFKKKRRKNYRRTHGHKQHQTVLRIADIAVDGESAAGETGEAATPHQEIAALRANTNAGVNARNARKARTQRRRNTAYHSTLDSEAAQDAD